MLNRAADEAGGGDAGRGTGVVDASGISLRPTPPGPIMIGFTTDLTGPAAQAAKDMVNGLTTYLDEIGDDAR